MPLQRRSLRVAATSRYTPYEYGPCPAPFVNSDTHFYTSTSSLSPKPVITSLDPTASYGFTVPQQITALKFDASKWAKIPRPANFLGAWPPTSASQLMNVDIDDSATGSTKQQANFLRKYSNLVKEDCLGKYCWQTTQWASGFLCAADFDHRAVCDHTAIEWLHGCEDWQSRFEIRRVRSIGYGLFSKQSWAKGDVLGIYLGELIPKRPQNTDYCHEVQIGPECKGAEMQVAYVDARKYGNYVRFCNHSCDNNAVVTEARVGNERVLALRAVKGIAEGKQVCVDYGSEYFRTRTCRCGTGKCKYSECAVDVAAEME